MSDAHAATRSTFQVVSARDVETRRACLSLGGAETGFSDLALMTGSALSTLKSSSRMQRLEDGCGSDGLFVFEFLI